MVDVETTVLVMMSVVVFVEVFVVCDVVVNLTVEVPSFEVVYVGQCDLDLLPGTVLHCVVLEMLWARANAGRTMPTR